MFHSYRDKIHSEIRLLSIHIITYKFTLILMISIDSQPSCICVKVDVECAMVAIVP